MKSLKTYNLDQDIINILARQPNKSQYVCRAVRKLSKGEENFDLRDVPTRTIYAALLSRGDVPHHIRMQLQHALQN